jgi:precorrin-4/cobalt-precorrin-4 C11-methyltransferase
VKVHFVGAGPGDPDLLTVKALRLLQHCRCCIYAGSLVNPAILDALPTDCERHDSAGMTLEEILTVIERCRDEGVDVVRLHTGEPAIYGAIGEQMRALDARGIGYDQVPGISAFQAAAATLTAELTAPEVAQTIILTRTAGRTPLPSEQDLSRLAASRATLCIYLSAHGLAEACETLIPFYGPDCPAAFVYHASWKDEQVLRGTLADLPTQVTPLGLHRTAIILVGRALGKGLPASKLYDQAFSHGYRSATGAGAAAS